MTLDSARLHPCGSTPPARPLRKARTLDLRYDGFSRRVEVHAVGYTKAGHPVMRAWQTGGGRTERIGWKLMRLDEAIVAEVTGEASSALRRGYKRGDPAMERIVA